MPETQVTQSDNQEAQRELVERGRSAPGVAEVMDVYGKLSQYTNAMFNVQLSEARNAVGGNVS